MRRISRREDWERSEVMNSEGSKLGASRRARSGEVSGPGARVEMVLMVLSLLVEAMELVRASEEGEVAAARDLRL